MFWGLIMEPQRRYTQIVKRPFHISMASLDISTPSEDPAQVMLGSEGRNYLLCTLRKPDMLQCPLDLNFEAGDEISLATNGKCNIHLTGYLIEGLMDDVEEEEETAEEEEEEEVVEKPEKKKKRNKSELKNGPPSKKVKSEEPEDSDEEESDADINTLLNSSLDTDEDDETFNDLEVEEAEEEEDDDEEEDENDLEDEEESSAESSLSEEEILQPRAAKKGNKVKMNGTPSKQDQQQDKKNKKNQQQQNKVDKNISPKKDSPKKVTQNGLIVEDIKEGQGQPAKPGKFITVYYEGRLKSNNKLFDSTKQGQGFSFKLGGGEVIKGWDQGLVGMKIGGKRRITCPPHMAYGAKGSPPAIPGNSTLVFEVELKKVR